MKHILNTLCMLFAVWELSAQQNAIVAYEYWLDDDYPAKTSQAVSPTQTFQWQTTIPCDNLAVGIHTFNARFKDTNGSWSSVATRYFYKIEMPAANDIVSCEYWIDDQYNSKTVKAVSANQSIDITEWLDAESLSKGMHVFNFRAKDKNGRWSSVATRYFYKIETPAANDIVSCEYWIDDQYNSKTVKAVSANQSIDITEWLDAESLSDGMHVFNFRAKDKNGRWSSTATRYFHKMQPLVDNRLVTYEYWINDNYDEKVAVQIPSQQTFVLLDSVACSLADKTVNSISYRFKDAAGLWSSTITEDFYYPVTISVNLTYTRSVLPGETPVVDNWYPNYSDVGYTLYNETKKQEISDIVFRYYDIVLTKPVDVGDSISITATKYGSSNRFDPVTIGVVIGEDNLIPVTFDLVQYGFIRSNYLNSGNGDNVGIVYDSEGNRIAQYDYSGKTLTTGELADGSYQLVSMESSLFYNTIQHLSAFAATELEQDIDYIIQLLEVESGVITETTISTIPELNENKLYYTTGNTLFSVNKTEIAVGNYVTLRGEIEFKEKYQTEVGNVKLLVDIPEHCTFFDNSVMIGSAVFNGYSIQNNQLTIPLADYSEAVKFCITPMQGGNYAPNGFVEFTLHGKTIRQPIGAANFKADGLNIVVPNITARETIPVRGVATANALVRVYDGDEFIGQTSVLANGNWTIQCELYDPYTFSTHNIYAEIITIEGLTLQTETKEVIHDISAIEVSKVTMYNMAHPSGSLDLYEYVTVFDFLNPPKVGGIYWYWPSYPDFTFKIEFTNNDPDVISDVKLHVLTAAGNTVILPTVYNKAKQLWVTTGQFDSYHLPVNVSVEFYYNRIN